MNIQKLDKILSPRTLEPKKGRRTLAISFVAALSLIVASIAGCGSMSQAEPKAPSNGQISVFVVSWPLTKRLVVPEAGLPNHKVTLVDPADHSVIATERTGKDGTVLFDLPPGTYEVLGAGDPRLVHLASAEQVNLKLIIH
jgi:hypothetical protein